VAEFLQQIINGLALGSIYALIALGYTMVYGIIKLINFAHGDVMMVGAYVGFLSITAFHTNIWIALIIAMIACAVLGMVIDRLAYKPLRNASRIAALITAIGVSLFLEYVFVWIFTPSQRSFPEGVISEREYHFSAISGGKRQRPYNFCNDHSAHDPAPVYSQADQNGQSNAGRFP
jgi:branched-chain amino acid transport system permease protein